MNKPSRFLLGAFGFILLVFGVTILIQGAIGLMNAESLTIVTIGNISGLIDVNQVSERDFTLIMVFNVALGVFFIFVANSFIYQATSEKMFHPRCGDILDLMKKKR